MTKTTTGGAQKKKSLRARLAEKAGARNREIHERGHFTVNDRASVAKIVAAIWADEVAANR